MKTVYIKLPVKVSGKNNEYCGKCGFRSGYRCYCFVEGGEALVIHNRKSDAPPVFRSKKCLKVEVKA